MRTAVIDIGTNTINLLIADISNEGFYKIILETAYPAKLGKGGINSKMILPDAMERGMKALRIHLDTIKRYNTDSTICIATSAMRDASNKHEFLSMVKKEFGLDIKIIDGKTEARLIFDGVKQVVPIGKDPVMILDIGGGSNEFIIADKEGVKWEYSFNLGVARLLDKFKPSDPITEQEIKNLENHFRSELKPLFKATSEMKIKTLIGASGSFDTIAAMIAAVHHPHFDVMQATSYPVSVKHFNELHSKLLVSTFRERLKMKKMVVHRVDTIVLATIFINFILREFNLEKVWQCSFALKEGTIHQIINHKL
ncbi:MAG: phosphatase [Chlorobi bacterium]|nr:phosphatase [Chlorobiota bacterium]